ncbi:trans-2'-carboxybenzalpyruvate hydratase-aldolase [Paraburkholderia fungorum]|jgi:trans-o-hydroxybenzylidenepyruvate hydratase-aldolase|uniref:Trans-O-hydroxybenzylidenepyruvate hydratase-aldolase n=4 Tax=Burkholderiaceae TaxID=119060 RepID=Q9ZHH6_9BURK|nr:MULTISPECIES: dihydrodipicolinate synthase family protein [Burkholderiaceae]AAD09869.1 hydratase/aldolase PhnE [Paraburkholderia sartisoli]ACT53260.1 hydratase/aldolase [Burkholderia sp. C3]ALE55136.1 aldolase [Burkholderia sp. HB1]KFX64016.1 aldolase [Burkholderia sp. K24]OWJ56143.1 aldolase [Burkholderia sp. Bk]
MSKQRKQRLGTEDVNGAWVIMPTPAKPEASDWRATDTVDLDETARIVEALIDSGVNGILSLGTFGECATLTWEEKQAFIGAVVETTRGRVPFFCGTTALNTREVVRQTRAALDIGVDGTMLGVPMWSRMEVPAAVQFYRDVAEACPEAAIAVYANADAFKFEFPRAFWAQVAQIPQVVTAKYLGIGMLDLDLTLAPGIRFLPHEDDYYAAARVAPERVTAFWSSGAMCGPATAIRLRDEVAKAKQTGDWRLAKELSDAMRRADATLFPRGDFAEFSKYNIAIEKERMNAAGWLRAGPCRPPYHIAPEEYLDGARQSGRAWAELHQQYSDL